MTARRIHGLDTFRAILLLLGVVLHAAIISRWSGKVEHPEFDWIQMVIHSFRMEAFFAVAGYLTALTLPRRQHYLKARLRQLLVPLACTWIFVLPIGWLALDGGHLWRLNELSILWFLVTLSVTTCLVVLAETYGLNRRMVDAIDSQQILIWLLLFYLIAMACSVAVNNVQEKAGIGHPPQAAIVRTVYYAPFFMLGFYSVRSVKLAALLRSRAARWIGILALLVYAAHLASDRGFYIGDRSTIERLVRRGVVTFVSVSMTITVLAWSGSLSKQQPFSDRMSDAAFTIYLFHLPILNVLYALSQGWDPWVQFLLFVPLATTICYAAHQLLMQSATLAFMFNGRPLPRGSSNPRAERRS